MNDPLHIGVNALFLIPGEVGGSQTYLLETLRNMAALPENIRFTVFTNRENDAFLRRALPEPCFRYHPLDFRASSRVVRILKEQLALPGAAARANIDVLWSPGYTAPLRAGCPQAISIFDMQYKRFPEDLSWIARRVTDFLLRREAGQGHILLTISNFSKGEIIQFLGDAPGRIHVTPLAADPAFSARPERRNPAVQAALGIPPGRPYLLCVANSYPHKNIPALLQAFALLQDEIPHQLVLAGKPRLGEAAVQAALQNVRRERVTRLDWCPRESLVALYQDADVFVFPSLYEGFGLPVLEAMRARTPVITTREGAIPEVGGNAAIYADGRDPADLAQRIREVLRWSPLARQAMLYEADAQAQTFSWRQTAALTLAALRAALPVNPARK
jgi:glycosyltransferase involved in cell wall biosynthesis